MKDINEAIEKNINFDLTYRLKPWDKILVVLSNKTFRQTTIYRYSIILKEMNFYGKNRSTISESVA